MLLYFSFYSVQDCRYYLGIGSNRVPECLNPVDEHLKSYSSTLRCEKNFPPVLHTGILCFGGRRRGGGGFLSTFLTGLRVTSHPAPLSLESSVQEVLQKMIAFSNFIYSLFSNTWCQGTFDAQARPTRYVQD